MTQLFADASRDPIIEDATNRWLIHPLSRAALGPALRLGISANMVSVAGLAFGITAAAAYLDWRSAWMAAAGLALSIFWLVADGLDGMIARATGTSSPAGRILDGLCDHGVFFCLYLALGWSMGMAEVWPLMLTAGIFHAAQSSLYEAERARYHRRIRGDGGTGTTTPMSTNPAIRLYDTAYHALDRWAERFDHRLRMTNTPESLAQRYRAHAWLPMKFMTPLSANTRVLAIFIACLAGDPKWFWWFEIGPLSAIAIGTMLWHRRVEMRLAA